MHAFEPPSMPPRRRARFGMAVAVAALLAASVPWSATRAAAPVAPGLDALDRELAAIFAEERVPGAAVAIVQADRAVLARGYGQADVTRGIAATPDTPFRAGSISKSVTALALMVQVEQGRLELEAPLRTLLPELGFDNPWEATDPLRLVHLLEHTTGWPDIRLAVLAKDGPGWTSRQGVELAQAGFTSRWPPGRFAVYNNAGPAVAALALERATGAGFEAHLRDTLLRPLGMARADFELTPALAADIARSYAPDGSETPYQHIVLRPAGALNASANELAQLVRLYLGRGRVDGVQLLSPASIERIERTASTLGAQAGFVQGYGLGVAPFPGPGITFRGHNGSIDSFTSVFGYSTRLDAGFVLLANGGAGVDFDSRATRRVIEFLTRDAERVPVADATPATGTLQQHAGYYRTITAPSALLRPAIELATFSRVEAADGRLLVSGREFVPAAGGGFRRSDREEPSLAFVASEGRHYKIGAFGTQAREPLWRMVLLWAWSLAMLASFAFALVLLLPWAVSGLRGRLAARGGVALRLSPVAGMLLAAATVVWPVHAFVASGTSAVESLARVGPASLTLLACSLAYPGLALLALVRAARAGSAPWAVRAYALLAGGGLVAFWIYAIAIGTWPLRSWAM